MSSLYYIVIIFVVIVICIIAITVIQKRENEKALLRQKISQYRYRANQASNILGNFSLLPIGTEARLILMQYCLANLKAIIKLSPSDQSALNNIQTLEEKIQSPDSAVDRQRFMIPSDMTQLTKQINQLSTLAKFILKLNKSRQAPANLVPMAVNKIFTLISESKICAYVQQGKESLSKHEYVPAQRNFIMAQQMLIKIPQKNERLTQLEVELQELIKSSPADAMNKQLSFDKDVDPDPPKEGDLFGPKKKW